MRKIILPILDAVVLTSVLRNTMVDESQHENFPNEKIEKFAE